MLVEISLESRREAMREGIRRMLIYHLTNTDSFKFKVVENFLLRGYHAPAFGGDEYYKHLASKGTEQMLYDRGMIRDRKLALIDPKRNTAKLQCERDV